MSHFKIINTRSLDVKYKLNSSWRLQSQMFLEAIRQAKTGVKLGDGRIDDRVLF